MRIGRKTQIGPASDVANAQKRPKQQHGSYKDGAVKERVEIVSCQIREHAMRRKCLSPPKKNRSKKRSDDDNTDKIGC
jgi:hypothetical protein